MEIGLLIILFVLAGVCLHLNSIGKSKNRHDFDTVIRTVLILLLVHTFAAFTGRIFPKHCEYIDWAAPFGLMYGPLLYAGYLSSKGSLPGKKKKTWIYIYPFFTAVLCAIISFFLPPKLRHSIGFVHGSALYAAISLLVYAVWSVRLVSRKKEMISIGFKNLLSSIVVILFTVAVFFVIKISGQTVNGIKSAIITTALLIYLGMLGSVVLIYQYKFRRFKEILSDIGDVPRPVLQKEKTVSQKLEYQKSSLKEEVMLAYSTRISAFVESGAYLDLDLSLGKVATELKIPKHHLSQLFSQYYKQGFLEYINTLRVRHACNILNNSDEDFNIADLAELCGFKSKPSFYRNFKTIMKMTPTEFQSPSK